MMCWHKWTKWVTYEEHGMIQSSLFSKEMIPYTETRQKRTCTKCGRIQDKNVGE